MVECGGKMHNRYIAKHVDEFGKEWYIDDAGEVTDNLDLAHLETSETFTNNFIVRKRYYMEPPVQFNPCGVWVEIEIA